MMLEDHAGDIIRKTREAAGISADKAAQAAGVSAHELSAFEESGATAAHLDYKAVGALIQLDPVKLARIAVGWVPAVSDLSQWRELRHIETAQGGMKVNCYLVWDEITREAALFDTGWEPEPVLKLIREHRLALMHIFITHDHRDHVAALRPIRDAHPKARLHSSAKEAPADQRNKASDFIHLGSLRINNRETPGHSEDGVTYLIGGFPDDAPPVAVTGDALFAGSIGRGFHNFSLLRQKVKQQVLSLPPETLICPGHGPLTTVGEEMANNPFF
jgi:glyoxylase-like metal-dependent hydrolase (beta-lactamase superfamily II)